MLNIIHYQNNYNYLEQYIPLRGGSGCRWYHHTLFDQT